MKRTVAFLGICGEDDHVDVHLIGLLMKGSVPAQVIRLDLIRRGQSAGRKILCKRFSTKSRMVLESRADSGLNPLNTESHGGQNGMRAGTA